MTKYNDSIIALLDKVLDLANTPNDPANKKPIIRAWLDGDGGATGSTLGLRRLTKDLSTAIAAVKTSRSALRNDYNLNALRMVHKLAGTSERNGAYTGILDSFFSKLKFAKVPAVDDKALEVYKANGGVNPAPVRDYLDKVELAKKAVIDLLAHLKAKVAAINPTDPEELAAALESLLSPNEIKLKEADLWHPLKKFIVQLRVHMAVKGQFGGGEGEATSSFWPSSFIVSSSSSSSLP